MCQCWAGPEHVPNSSYALMTLQTMGVSVWIDGSQLIPREVKPVYDLKLYQILSKAQRGSMDEI